MYSSTPANFNDQVQLPILKQQRRQTHNVTRKKKNKLEKFFDELRNNESKNGIEGFSNDGDSDSEDEMMLPPPENTQGISANNQEVGENTTIELPKPMPSNTIPDKSTIAEPSNNPSNYAPQQNIFRGHFDSISKYNDGIYKINKDRWNMPETTTQPRFHLPTPSSGEENILNKLNYAIQLLEEKRDQKTEHVTEELILYGFLGIFIIFSIDSFIRVGEYKR